MGLDMFLVKRKEGVDEPVELMYWRKANAIHKWFTRDYEERGFEDDNCTSFPQTKDSLTELINICDKVLDNHSLADELLPSGSGFFWGSTEYDDWYYDDVEQTRDSLNHIIANEFPLADDERIEYYAWY